MDLFNSSMSRQELANLYYDLLLARGEERTAAWAEADRLELVGRAALVRAIEDVQAELV